MTGPDAHAGAVSAKPLLSVLRGAVPPVPPMWLMRQAGRYLPEYRALRADKGGFLELVYDSAAAAEVTLQPLRRFGFDGAILKCVDEAGEKAWSKRGIGNGAVLAAGDRLLVMGGTGELIVAKATETEYTELSKVQLFDEGKYWTKPILCNGIIYCRSSKGTMVARDHRE